MNIDAMIRDIQAGNQLPMTSPAPEGALHAGGARMAASAPMMGRKSPWMA